MKTNEIIREMMVQSGMRFNEFSRKLEVKTNALANRLNRGNFSTDLLNEMLDVFGYKLVIVPKETELQDNWYAVEKSKGTDCEEISE